MLKMYQMPRLIHLWILTLLSVHTLAAQSSQVGDLAPDFTLEQLDGSSVSLSDFLGKVVYINFFGYS